VIIFLIVAIGVAASFFIAAGLVGILVCIGATKTNRDRLDALLAVEVEEWAADWAA
jgi:hypothetical protein